jgi:hypothetical protein
MRNSAQSTFPNDEKKNYCFFGCSVLNGSSAETATGTWQIIGKYWNLKIEGKAAKI